MRAGANNFSPRALSGGWDNHPGHGGGQAVIEPGWIEPAVSLSGNLMERFICPPFSVLDTRQGYWQERRRWWLGLGIQSEIGRGLSGNGAIPVTGQAGVMNAAMAESRSGPARAFAQDLMRNELGTLTRREADQRSNVTGAAKKPEWATGTGTENVAPGTSIFDPVLCELVYRWFCPPGGIVLDPFAGGSVRGIVAAYLGHPYVGVDLSRRQVDANRAQAAQILTTQPVPRWIVGDSQLVLSTALDAADLVFTCPPYYDLEVYSDDPRDLSGLDTYVAFLEAYRSIIEKAVAKLRPGRFACIVVSEIRGPDGTYRGLVPDTIAAFVHAGMRFYNEAILVNSVGSLPIRITKQFEAGRKLGRTHQNVLVFLKGDQPRGWSYDRDDPPDPQLSMFGDAA